MRIKLPFLILFFLLQFKLVSSQNKNLEDLIIKAEYYKGLASTGISASTEQEKALKLLGDLIDFFWNSNDFIQERSLIKTHLNDITWASKNNQSITRNPEMDNLFQNASLEQRFMVLFLNDEDYNTWKLSQQKK